ncbi:hypothetical protein [Streptomyces cylindrosporus]|uniref:Uncharacterized protein n=1 Tax=Streptomyces cylindrosporus TaxID=2927583 RepID=A0ABS9YPD3_9ACTN|nr:hypothetical protein [Streptomyces cylindrosporus]MCI3279094.1 hypothetical protein [Streptomyces cylindrosporus]
MTEQPIPPRAYGVHIEATPGDAVIRLDGEPLPPGQVTGYVLQHDVHGALPSLILHTRQPHGVLFEGLATVAVAVQQDHGDVIEEFLSGIDPAGLSRAALDRDDLDPGKHGVAEAMLKQLADWAKGRS